MTHRVVVTGMGAVSCLGDSLDRISLGLQEGRSGVIFSPERKEHGFRPGLMTALPNLDLQSEPDRHALRRGEAVRDEGRLERDDRAPLG